MARLCLRALTLLLANCCFSNIHSVRASDPDWWKTSVIYQIYPRSFKDSDGDGVGDINGIISKLDYIVNTGINAIWLSPIFKSPMVDFGYDISDYKEIDPLFGTMKDFDNLRKLTKEKGIKLILDFVPNHSSDQHDWFQKSIINDTKHKDYYIWTNGRVIEETYEPLPPNNWLSVFGGPAWTWNADRGQYYLHQYTIGQPDLNYRNKQVRKDMQDIMTFWLNKGVDGFRVDAVSRLFEDKDLRHEKRSMVPFALPGNYTSLKHTLTVNLLENHGLIAEWRNLVDKFSQEEGNTRIIFTECKGDFKEITSYYGNSTHPEAHFPFNFDLIKKITNESKALDFKNVIDTWLKLPAYNWLTGSHDNSRVASRLGRDMVDIMNMLVLLLPGTAITYNGEEIGMEDTPISWEEAKDPRCLLTGKRKYASYTRDPERTPFQWDDSSNAGFSTSKTWLPVNSNYKELNLQKQMMAAKSHYETYKRLVQARKEHAIKEGNLIIQTPNDDLLILIRELVGKNSFVLIINLGTQVLEVNLNSYSRLGGNFTVYATSVNSPLQIGSTLNDNITLQPKEAVVLENLPHGISQLKAEATFCYDCISILLITISFALSRFIISI